MVTAVWVPDNLFCLLIHRSKVRCCVFYFLRFKGSIDAATKSLLLFFLIGRGEAFFFKEVVFCILPNVWYDRGCKLKYEKEWREIDMAMTEVNSLDMSAVLLHAYDVGDLINASTEVADYLYWKKKMEQDEEVQKLVRLFIQKKSASKNASALVIFIPIIMLLWKKCSACRTLWTAWNRSINSRKPSFDWTIFCIRSPKQLRKLFPTV